LQVNDFEFPVAKFRCLLNNSEKLNDSWRKRFHPSVEMTASFGNGESMTDGVCHCEEAAPTKQSGSAELLRFARNGMNLSLRIPHHPSFVIPNECEESRFMLRM